MTPTKKLISLIILYAPTIATAKTKYGNSDFNFFDLNTLDIANPFTRILLFMLVPTSIHLLLHKVQRKNTITIALVNKM